MRSYGPTSSWPDEEPTDPGRVAKSPGIGWGVYQQIAAVFAAFGIAAFIGHFWRIGWRGSLEALVGVWAHTVRPATEWLLHVLVSVPLGWLGVQFEIHEFYRDYFSVAVIMILSIVREFTRGPSRQLGLMGGSATDGEIVGLTIAIG